MTLIEKAAHHMRPPIMAIGGFLIPIVLLRWRRREAWLILSMSVMPQAWYPYGVLPLLTIGTSLRESCILALFASVAVAPNFLPYDFHSAEMVRIGGAIMVLAAYIPAVVVVLLRPNEPAIPTEANVRPVDHGVVITGL
jgi:hypothetical protein